MAGFFVDNGYKAHFDFTRAATATRFSSTAGNTPSTCSPAPTCRGPRGLHLRHRPHGSAAALGLGHHQCRWHDYTRRASSSVGREYRERGIPCDVLWLDIGHMDGYRVFTWDQERFPDAAEAPDARCSEHGFRRGHDRRPGREDRAGLRRCSRKARATEPVLQDRSRRSCTSGRSGRGAPCSPTFARAKRAPVGASSSREHVALGVAGIWNDMNEPATGDVEPFAMRFDRDGENHPHERFHNQYALADGAWRRTRGCSRSADRAPLHSQPRGLRRHPALRRAVARRQLLDVGAPRDEHADGARHGHLGPALRRRRHPRLRRRARRRSSPRAGSQYGALTPFCRCHNKIGDADQYPWSFGPGVEAIAPRALELRYRLLPYLYTAFVARARAARRSSARWSSISRTTQGPSGSTTSSCSGARCSLRPCCSAVRESDTSICPRATGSVGTTARAIPVEVFISRRLRSIESRCTFERTRSCPCSTACLRAPAACSPRSWSFTGSSGALTARDLACSTKTTARRTPTERALTSRRGSQPSSAPARLRSQPRLAAEDFPEFRRRALRLVLHGAVARTAWLDGRALTLEGDSILFENRGEPFELRAEV